MLNVKKYFDSDLPTAISSNPVPARGMGGSYQLDVAGVGSWAIDLSVDPPTVAPGKHPDPKCKIEISEADLRTIYTFPIASVKLFTTGRVRVVGNPMLALNLRTLIQRYPVRE